MSRKHASSWRRSVSAVAVAAAAIVVAVAPAGALAAPGDAVVVPLQITGPPSERLNLVIMGDGYTAAEMQKFRDDVDRNQNIQWSVEPFRTYRNYINTYRLEIESQDSGISCDPDDGNIRRNTPLRLNYTNTCPADPLARGITYGPALSRAAGARPRRPSASATRAARAHSSTTSTWRSTSRRSASRGRTCRRSRSRTRSRTAASAARRRRPRAAARRAR